MTIKELRKESGMTQKEFGDFSYGISEGVIAHWESGRRDTTDYLVKLIEYRLRNELSHMKDYNEARWGCLSEEDKQYLLSESSPVDGITGVKPKKSSECIIDLVYPYSIAGYFEKRESEDEIIIDDNAIIYGSLE